MPPTENCLREYKWDVHQRYDTWAHLGRCVNTDTRIMYPDTLRAEYRTAQQVCTGCPVQLDCLEYATVSEEHLATTNERASGRNGVWGGFAARERKNLMTDIRKRAPRWKQGQQIFRPLLAAAISKRADRYAGLTQWKDAEG